MTTSYHRHNIIKLIIQTVTWTLALLYLVVVTLGIGEINRLGTTELALLGLLVLFNSDIVDRIRKLGIGKEGISVEIEALKEEQEKLVASQDRIRYLINQQDSDEAKQARQELIRGLPPIDQVNSWAQKYGASNAFDLGPKNWQRCLWDLGFGGQDYELKFDSDRKLVYQ